MGNIEFYRNIALLIIILGAIIWLFKNSSIFTPETNKRYVLKFLGIHLWEISPGKEDAPLWAIFPFYILLPGFSIATFLYKWRELYTYAAAMKKIKELEEKGMTAKIVWTQPLRESELKDGLPKNQNTTFVILEQSKMMQELNPVEKWIFPAPFETQDRYFGERLITLTFRILDLSKIISSTHAGVWQNLAEQFFNKSYRKWTTTIDYTDYISKTTDDAAIVFPEISKESISIQFRDNLDLGFEISLIADGKITYDAGTQNLLDSMEASELADNEAKAQVIKNAMEEMKAETEASIKIKKGTAEATVLGLQLKEVEDFISKTTDNNDKLIKSKYGVKGLGGVTGVVVDNAGNTGQTPVDTGKIVEMIIANNISEKTKGGASGT